MRREGRFTQAQKDSLRKFWPQYGLDAEQGLVDFVDVFGNQNPTWLEIGFGNGLSLAQMAAAQPAINFIGAEVYRPGVGRLLSELERAKTGNVRVFAHDAVVIIDGCIAKNSLDRILIFFPDPWHKKRHNKRRLIQAGFLDTLAARLKPEGIVHIATDWQDYAEWILAAVGACEWLENTTDGISEKPAYRPLTKYEQRGQRLGHRVYDFVFNKVAA